MLRPIYQYLLHKYGYQESDNSKPWYQQKQPQSVLENTASKVQWNVPFHLKRAPSNGDNRIDMSVWDKVENKWYFLEASVCQVVKIQGKTELNQEKYTELRAGINIRNAK